MTERQLEIYKGLKSIGTEIAAFYFDGVLISEMDLDTKSYLLGHLSREIESGLRDVLSPKNTENVEICDKCLRSLNRKIGHKKSIIHSLGLEDETEFVKQWYKVAKQFPKYAHRHGAWKDPREQKTFDKLWHEFEDILEYLVGNYYAIADRLDVILRMQEPSEEVLNTLPNLLKQESRFLYFFKSLKSRKWLLSLENEGYFDGIKNPEPKEVEDNPGYFTMPYWAVLSYLEEVANQNLVKPEKETTEALLRIIESIIQYRNSDGQRVENYRTDFTIFKIICSLPEEHIKDNHFEFIKTALQSKWEGFIGYHFKDLLDRLLNINNKDLLLKGIDVLLSYKTIDEKYEQIDSIFNGFELQGILTDFKQKIIPILGIDLLKYSLNKIDEINDSTKYSFHNMSITAIEDHEQTLITDKYECQLVYLVRDILEKLDSNETIEYVKVLLKKKHPINKRIAIHTIRVRFSQLNSLFWSLKENPIEFKQAKHEVYELIKQHSKDFTNDEINQVFEWINLFVDRNESQENETYKAYQKKEWLTSLLPSGSKKVIEMLDELNKINDTEVKHPGFDSYRSVQSGYVSPLSIEEINKKSIEEIINFYHEFIKQDHDFMGPSTDGLLEMITLTVRHNTNKYITKCTSLAESPSPIQYAWIRGLGESWRDENNSFDCKEVFNIVLRILKTKKFWELYNSDSKYNRWFITNLLSFINDGLENDKHAFNQTELPKIKEILIIILENDQLPVSDYKNLSMTVLNNSKGKTYICLFQYSLRLARIEAKEKYRWDSDVKKIILKKVELNEKNFESSLLFYVIGQFLFNILFLDKKWLIKNFDKLFPDSSKTNLSGILNGYFRHNPHPNDILFNLILESNLFYMAFKENLIHNEVKKNVVNHICNAYLFNWISIDNEIIQNLLETKDQNIFFNLIFFFWSPQRPITKEHIQKIKPLWLKIYNRSIQLKNEESDIFLLSGCCKWINHLESIDQDIFDILINSAPFINNRDRSSVIEALSKHIEKTPEMVGLVLIELFNKEVKNDIYRDKLKDMVEIIYSNGFKKIGDKICVLHGEKGFDFLREIYDKYNEK